MGDPGLGKTTLAHVALLDQGYQVIEVNASDTRSYKDTYKLLERTCLCVTLRGKSALVFDEVDGAQDVGKDSITAMMDFFSRYKTFRNKAPVICICNSIYKGGVRRMLKYCRQIKFDAFTPGAMKQIALAALARMGRSADMVEAVVLHADGDARQAILGARFPSGDTKDHQINMFAAAKRFFRPKTQEKELRQAIDVMRGTGHLAGGMMLESYVSVAKYCDPGTHTASVKVCENCDALSRMDRLSEFADSLVDYDQLNHWQYKEHTDDGGIAHSFLAASAQALVRHSHPGVVPDTAACKRVFHGKAASGLYILDDPLLVEEAQFMPRVDKWMVDELSSH